MNNLTETEKTALKFFVESIQNGVFGENFSVVWGASGPHIKIKNGFTKAPWFNRVTLDGLQQAGLILWRLSGTKAPTAVCTVKPKAFETVKNAFIESTMPNMNIEPTEIRDSLHAFRKKYPDPSKVAFIIMRFGKTQAHTRIAIAIKTALLKHGITALRADDFEFHDDLFLNILTYIYGCGFAVAFFERIQSDDPNPNVALEVGYMLALRKNVCLFKDQTLKALPTDLISKLYRDFDQTDPDQSISAPLENWLISKGIIDAATIDTEAEALRMELSTLKELMDDSDFLCPKCKAPLSLRKNNTLHGTIDGIDVEGDVSYTEYQCGSAFEDSRQVSPCRNPRP